MIGISADVLQAIVQSLRFEDDGYVKVFAEKLRSYVGL